MIQLTRTDAANPGFHALVSQLDAELRFRDGKEHAFFAQYNKLDDIRYVVLALDEGRPVGCGAIKAYGEGVMEVKRMFVLPARRGEGIAAVLLQELEKWAVELNFFRCILETGIRQPEAIGLYKKSGYTVMPNYGQYADRTDSVCFEKFLQQK